MYMLLSFNAILLLFLSLSFFKIRILNVGNVLTKRGILIGCVYPYCILSKYAPNARICFMSVCVHAESH